MEKSKGKREFLRVGYSKESAKSKEKDIREKAQIPTEGYLRKIQISEGKIAKRKVTAVNFQRRLAPCSENCSPHHLKNGSNLSFQTN